MLQIAPRGALSMRFHSPRELFSSLPISIFSGKHTFRAFDLDPFPLSQRRILHFNDSTIDPIPSKRKLIKNWLRGTRSLDVDSEIFSPKIGRNALQVSPFC